MIDRSWSLVSLGNISLSLEKAQVERMISVESPVKRYVA